MVQVIKFSQFGAASLNDATRTVVGTATGANVINPDQNTWTTSTRPLTPFDGLMGYNTTNEQWEYWQNSTLSWISFSTGGGSGTVTDILTGTGLTGGPIMVSGTISLSPISNDTFLANATGITAAPIPTTMTAFFDTVFGTDQGSILYRNSSTWTILGPGSSGQFLKTLGASANPLWANPTGTGTVNAGLQNQLGWYASNGTTISGLSTEDSGILVTSLGGVPSISTTIPAGITIPQPLIQGVTDGSNAASGDVGQFISSIVMLAGAVSISSGTSADVTSISLTPGDWDVQGNVSFVPGSVMGSGFSWISKTSATLPDFSLFNGITSASAGSLSLVHVSAPYIRMSLATTTTIYLSCQSTFSTSCVACGGIYARRVR